MGITKKRRRTVNKGRLAQLAIFLLTVPKERFTMDKWITGQPFCLKPEEGQHPQCGTAGCAFGWATAYPPFAKLGLRAERFDNKEQGCISFGAEDGMSAARSFFGLTRDEAEYLFGVRFEHVLPKETPKRVSKRIQEFVLNGKMNWRKYRTVLNHVPCEGGSPEERAYVKLRHEDSRAA